MSKGDSASARIGYRCSRCGLFLFDDNESTTPPQLCNCPPKKHDLSMDEVNELWKSGERVMNDQRRPNERARWGAK